MTLNDSAEFYTCNFVNIAYTWCSPWSRSPPPSPRPGPQKLFTLSATFLEIFLNNILMSIYNVNLFVYLFPLLEDDHIYFFWDYARNQDTCP